ncbi:efflux RND transporter periplasmic adaptor subunit [Roseospira visakhapatnamensis]|uniref:RND family efflux transporter MFP subunit n=1 Tax=Roseospira visakhapatnamensis TaxID=390880 RepID=A0A7W6RGE7_9PROT|nr:efflux RND transporter periplasmic adaptor subunit [Roseospira visakhapatnamensis]MBB4267388.1 RND family efflux transporter MFP subunit [Roseospira visakhapatnamensis]
MTPRSERPARARRQPVLSPPLPGVLSLLLLLPLALAACDEPDAPADAATPTEEVARPARLAIAEPSQGTEVHEFPARTEAVQEVDLSFRVAGLLNQLPITEGELVPMGTLVAALDDTDFALALREAEVNLKSARQDFARKQDLVNRNVVSRQAFDDAKTAVELAEVAVDKARQDLEYTRLEAPFDAIISRRLVESFTNVQAGQQIMRLQDVSEIRVAADIPEHLVARHHTENTPTVEAIFPFLDDLRFPLAFREISTDANDVAQTYRIEFGMPRPEAANILPGMTAKVRATVSFPDQPHDAVTIPAGALVPARPTRDADGAVDGEAGGDAAEGAFFVWAVDPSSGAVSRRPVTIGHMDNRTVTVLSGLRAGDPVVTAGVHQLRDGMRVKPLRSE